jgi:hypothetical protein
VMQLLQHLALLEELLGAGMQVLICIYIDYKYRSTAQACTCLSLEWHLLSSGRALTNHHNDHCTKGGCLASFSAAANCCFLLRLL